MTNKRMQKEISKAIRLLEDAKIIIESCRDDEQESFDNLPEGIGNGDKGEKVEINISSMEEAVNNIDEAIEQLNNTIEP